VTKRKIKSVEPQLRVVQVVAGLHQDDGGPYQTLPLLWSGLVDQQVGVKVFTTGFEEDITRLTANKYELFTAEPSFPEALKRAPGFHEEVERGLGEADLCHNHGCWLYPNWVAGSVARKAQKPLIISPLGHLDRWSLKYHGWRKWFVRHLIEKKNWAYASAFVAKSDLEAEQMRRLGFEQPISVIPNGLDAKAWKELVPPEIFLEKFPELKDRKLLLFLSRIHPKKGIFPLLNVWKLICGKYKDWHLVVAGMDSPYSQEIQKWLSQQSFKDRVTFAGDLEGDVKRSAMTASSLFVLPSFSENFGQVVLEALASGLPVITTKGCPWEGIEKHQCGWWIEMEEVNLRDALVTALGHSETKLRQMGQRGRKWVLKDYDWETLISRLKDLYQEVLDK
jgi:glycosyltransferase involved in cell wall biosynthesis